MTKQETKIVKKLFGSEIEIIVFDVDELIAQDIIEETYHEGLRLQKIFNIYDSKSELNQLNKKRKILASDELIEVIAYAIKYCELTNGEYDISLGQDILKLKNEIHKNNNKNTNKNTKIKIQTIAEIENKKTKKQNITEIDNKKTKIAQQNTLLEKQKQNNYKNIIIEKEKKTIKLTKENFTIDLGSIAKGYITDKMIEHLQSQGINSGLIDSRGDIRFFGSKTQTIAIQNPRNPNKIIATVKLKNCAIASSGDYAQYLGNYNHSHILNQKELISVTSIAKTLMDADLFATLIFVSCKKAKEKLLNTNPHIQTLTINKKLQINMFNGFEENII